MRDWYEEKIDSRRDQAYNRRVQREGEKARRSTAVEKARWVIIENENIVSDK